MSLHHEGCPSNCAQFQGTAWQNSLWIWSKARLIEFWYVIKSSNKSAQIPLQPTIQHSWAPQANYDEVIISAKGSALDGSSLNRVESFQRECAQPWGKGIVHVTSPKDRINVTRRWWCIHATTSHFTAVDYLKHSKHLDVLASRAEVNTSMCRAKNDLVCCNSAITAGSNFCQ